MIVQERDCLPLQPEGRSPLGLGLEKNIGSTF